MLDGEREAIAGYVALIGDFVRGSTSAPEFEDRFQARYLADQREWSEETFQLLDRLFADVDFFVAEDDLREPEKGDLDADGLRAAARRALDGLAAL